MIKRLIIIDGNSLINRAYYAMQKPMITKDGIYTQGIYGFLNMLNKLKDDYEPMYMAVAWDMKAPTFRHKEYSDYKAGRKKMPPELAMELPIIKDILTAMHIPNLELEGYEADDILGTVSRIGEEAGLDPLVVTGDKDSLQLVTEKVHVLYTKRGVTDFDIYDMDKMKERYELTPEQFIDLKGLMGDQSDNIPGIPGVGEKTGIKLLKEFGSVAELVNRTDEISNAKLRAKVEENVQLAIMSRRLATINKFVPMEVDFKDYQVMDPDYTTLFDIYTKLEFNSFLKKLAKENITSSEIETNALDFKGEKLLIDSLDDMDKLNLKDKEIVLKVFTDNNHVDMPDTFGASILADDKYFYINLTDKAMREKLCQILDEEKPEIIGHSLVKDYYSLMFAGANSFNTKFDTEIAAYVIDPSKSEYSLKTLAFELLRCEVKDEKEFLEENSQISLLQDNKEQYMDFGLYTCLAIKALKKVEEDTLIENQLFDVFNDIELPLIEVLASMEKTGVKVDKEAFKTFGKGLKENIDILEKEIYSLAGKEFNINSPIQLGDVLFEDLGLPAGKKTKRGYSTSADVLEKIKDKHPIVNVILDYRTLTKLNSTYVEGMKKLIGPDGRIRAHFQQTVAATGRLSCTEPNLQNIPVRSAIGKELRKAFTATEDGTLVGADYSQIELRIMAHLSGDENLINAFNNGDDIHRMTAARVFNLPYDEVTPLDRSKAKAVNFGVIYGMSGFGLSEELKITRREADSYIKDYFEKHKPVKEYLDSQVAYAKEYGFAKTITGRKRYIHEINASNFMTRQFGERLAMNSPIQGSAADIIKIAMIKVYNELKERKLKSRLILQIHDELIIDTVKGEEDIVKDLIVRNMEESANLKVKLVSDMNSGYTWFDLK